ncbi:MAG: 7-cyano-7-deazaguanine synthase [Thermoguttaceae bacterium]
MTSNAPIGLLLSGGLDSCILLGHLLEEGRRVRPFYIDSGLAWQAEEAAAAMRFLEAMTGPRLDPLVTLQLPLGDLYGGHWSVTGRDVPDATTADEAVYLPGRNALLMIKAALWCRMHGIEQLALGVLQSNPFSDTTADFFDHFESALNCGDGNPVRIVRPFAKFDKQQVMQLGRELPLQLTFSCIAPTGRQHCGRCNKCAERRAAFRLIGTDDPTRYATSTKHE